jgi:hypothetical protein
MNSKILVITWNTQSNRLAESINLETLKTNRETGYLWRQGSVSDFWIPLKEKIKQENPFAVIIGFQEDVSPGSYFHSHLLPEEMTKIGYEFYDRTTLMGFGQTSVEAISQADLFLRGLRLSVYLKNGSRIKLRYQSQSYTSSIFRNKGGVSIYLSLPNDEVLAIVNTHFPFESNSLIEMVQKKNFMIRQNSLFAQNSFYNEMYQKLIIESPARPQYILVFGDLNYRILPFVNYSAKQTGELLLECIKTNPQEYTNLINKHDELTQQLNKGNIYPFKEGIMNNGPCFAPTCKMKKDRKPGNTKISDYSLGKYDQRVPSHAGRILYNTLATGRLTFECTEYDRFDYGVMSKSDHTGVLGIFTIS